MKASTKFAKDVADYLDKHYAWHVDQDRVKCPACGHTASDEPYCCQCGHKTKKDNAAYMDSVGQVEEAIAHAQNKRKPL